MSKNCLTLENKKNIPVDHSGLINGAISLTVAVFIVKMLGYIYKLPLSLVLGDDGMGYFNSAYTVFSFFYLLCSGGIPRAVSILICEIKAKNSDYQHSVYSIILRFFGFLGFVLTVVLFVFSGFMSKLIGNTAAKYSVMCIAPSLLFVSIGGVARGYLNSCERFGTIAVSQVVEGVIKFIFGLFFALLAVRMNLGKQYVAAMTITGVTLGSFACTVYLLICSKLENKRLNIRQNALNAKHRKAILYRLFLIAAPLTFTAAISGITSVIDLSLIMNRLIEAGLSEERAGSLFGNYTTLVVPMLNLTMALIAPITVAALPNIAALHSTGQNNQLKKNASDYIKITSFVAFPLFFGFLLFSKEILCLLFNDNSATIAYSSLSFISPSILFLPIITMINTVLEGTGHRKAPLIIMSIASVVKLVISYVLLGDKRYLILGAPIGTTVSYTVAFILCVGLLKLYCNIGFDYLFFILRTGIISLLSVSLGKYIYEQIAFDIFSPVKFIICVLISIVAYFSISFFFNKFVGENIQKHVNLNKNDSQKLLN